MSCGRTAGVGIVLGALLAALLQAPAAPAAASPDPGPPPDNPATALERRLAEDIFARANDERARRGVPPLAWDRELAVAGMHWVRHNAAISALVHSTPSHWREVPWALHQFRWAGENLYVGSGPFATGAAANRGWMRSDGHRRAMLFDGFDAGAVGVYCEDGWMWAALMFGMHRGGRAAPGDSWSEDVPLQPIVHDTDVGGGCDPATHGLLPSGLRYEHDFRRFPEWAWWQDVTERVPLGRIAGSTRLETAAALATAAHPDGAGEVLLASAAGYADALAGGYLGGLRDAPVLLTGSSRPADEARDAILTLRPETVTVLGGPAAIGGAVAAEVAGLARVVERVAGDTRFGTAANAARAGDGVVGTLDGKPAAIVASGQNWPDALVASALAAGERLPVLLTTRAGLHPEAEAAIRELGIEVAIVPGGEAVVAPEVVAALRELGVQVHRIAGRSRTETAAAVAAFAVDRFGWDPGGAVVATGQSFADALTAAPFAGGNRAPVVLSLTATRLGGDAEGWLRASACGREALWVVGGTGVVSLDVSYLAQQAATCLEPQEERYPVNGGEIVCDPPDEPGGERDCRFVPG